MKLSSAAAISNGSTALRLVGLSIVVVGLLMTIIPPVVTAVVRSEHPLDKYPGFGRSQHAMVRDDTIALWEAFSREVDISECMADAGFDYWPAVAYPGDALLDVANDLGVQPTDSGASPFDRNRAYQAGLSAADRDAYSIALYGENHQDMAEAMRTGRVPEGREASFAKGGCFGKAERSQSIWDLRRSLDDQLIELNRDVFRGPALAAARAAFRGCAQQAGGISASDPSELDELVARTGSTVETERVRSSCLENWGLAHAKAEREAAMIFAQDHAKVLTDWDRRYQGVIDAIRSDDAFLAYLAGAATFASEGGDSH